VIQYSFFMPAALAAGFLLREGLYAYDFTLVGPANPHFVEPGD
jgi:hypothetical protein